jgi:hypothetical protein
LTDRLVLEGLASVFERDMANMPAPCGQYPPNVSEWVEELLALPTDTPTDPFKRHHPDGRRWVGYKVGTCLATRN